MTTPSELETILRAWDGRPSVAVVNLDQLTTNVRALRGMVGERVKLMTVVKADGYGHGSIPVAKAAIRAGADELGVATVEEGVRLRRGGVTAPILVMGPIGALEKRRAIAHDLMLVIGDLLFAKALAADVRASGRKSPLEVHLKVDTGMHRFGVAVDEAADLARVIDDAPELRLAGVMTHFAASDDPDTAYTMEQAGAFDRACAAIREAGIEVRGQHLCNSAATLRFPELHRDRVRVGIAMYGLRPDPEIALPEPFAPILTVHSRITRILELQAGDRVSYGGTWIAPEPARVALVPLGYADGYRRQGSNLAWMDVRGEEVPVRGRVCMDQTLVQVGADARPNDHVTVVGDGRNGVAPSLDRLATLYGTISHEMATGMVIRRLAHLYVQDGRLIAITDLWGYRELNENALAQPEPSEAALAATP
jgi:alanine racemase